MLSALTVLFVGTLVGINHVGNGANSTLRSSNEQVDSLKWAQEAVNGFAMTQGRLPCPASTRGGVEDCATSFAKGWLPTASIEQFAQPTGARGRLHARYVVYRGTGAADPDLAIADDAYQPATVDGAPVTNYAKVVSTVDLCGKLRAVVPPNGTQPRWQQTDAPAAMPSRGDRANVAVPGGSIGNVAYGIAIAPTGTSETGSGLNADATPRLESSQRPLDGTYRDVVRTVGFDALYGMLSCPITMASLDTLAIARGWADEGVGMRQGTIDGSMQLVKLEGVIVSSEAIEVASSTIDLANTIQTELQSTAMIATGEAGMPATLPQLLAGIKGAASSFEGMALAATDFGTSTTGLLVESSYALIYLNLAKKAEAFQVWETATSVLETADTLGTAP